MSYHTIVLVGRLTRDPELRYTPSGKAVANLNLAVDDGWGENKKTIWVRVTVWDKQAETVCNYVSKGRQLLVEGRLSPDKDSGNPRVYQRQDGSWGSSYEVTANIVRFLGTKGDSGEDTLGDISNIGDFGGGDLGDEDIPF